MDQRDVLDTYLYLIIDEGVKNLQDPRFIQLAAEGLKLFSSARMDANSTTSPPTGMAKK